jgi:plastocyanin
MSAALPGILKGRSRLLGVALGVAALAAAACAPAEEPPHIPVKMQGQLLIQVVDQLYDAGRGVSVALHKDGSPAISYLLYKPVLEKGDIPPPVLPGQPQPPAVILATLGQGVWNRASVTPQNNNPAQGDAPELANDQGQAVPGTTTGIAVDAQDKHHLVWSTPKGGLFYADDTSGGFGEAEKITGSPAFGASIAVGSGGSPWVSFYSGGSLRVAQRSAPGKWTSEQVQPNAGPAAAAATVTAIRVSSNGEPIVAYGDQGRTVVARRSGGSWATEQVQGDGGYGVSLALDKAGNPHVAFYDTAGTVRLARSTGGGPWEVADLGTTAPGPDRKSDARWSTGVAVDDGGTMFVTWADTKANRIVLADNPGGNAATRPVSGSTNGTNPSLAVSADGKSLALAWFDSSNANLEVAQSPAGGLALAHPLTPAATPTGGGQPTAAPAECEPDGTTLQISALNIAFDKNCLAAPAGKSFTIDFNNQEATPHNVEIFPTAQDAASFSNALGGATGPSDIVAGPATVTYKVDALEAGTYYFQCDVHPQQMNGTFVVK